MYRSQLWRADWAVSGSACGTDIGVFLYSVFFFAHPAAQQTDICCICRSEYLYGTYDSSKVCRSGSVPDVVCCPAQAYDV